MSDGLEIEMPYTGTRAKGTVNGIATMLPMKRFQCSCFLSRASLAMTLGTSPECITLLGYITSNFSLFAICSAWSLGFEGGKLFKPHSWYGIR